MQTVRIRAPILAVLMLIAHAGAALADVAAEQVLPLLSGYEWRLDSERFAALPAATYQALLEVVASDRYAPFLRERAAVALSLYPNLEVRRFFVDRVHTEPDPVVRRGLVQAFCAGFVRSDPASVEEAMAPLLEERDAHLRVRAAKCLRSLGSASAQQRVEAYRARIRDAWEARATAAE